MEHNKTRENDTAVDAVRAVLQMFQEGYSHRDTQAIEGFMGLFASDAQLEVVGTSAIDTTGSEWCQNISSIRTLIEADWHEWGDLLLDVKAARIQVNDGTAWLSTTGTVSQTLPLEHAYMGMATFLRGFMERHTGAEETANKEKANIESELLTVIQGAASALLERRQGEHHVWPIHFSYPTVHLPQVRWS